MPNVVRVASVLAMAVGVFTSCSSAPPRTADAPAAPPIEARILPPFQDMVMVDVNQPTYVAVFDVRPYIGIEMIYPGPNDEGRAVGGIQALTTFHLVQAIEERRAQATPFVGGGEDYLYLLASRTPLHLGEFADHPIALSDAAGVSQRALPPYVQIDSLMRHVVQPMYDNDWDADVLILSPGPNPSVNESQLGLDCGIDTGKANKICAHQDRIVQPIAVGPGGQPTGAASAGQVTNEAERVANRTLAEASRTHARGGSAAADENARGTSSTGTLGSGTVSHTSMSGSASGSTPGSTGSTSGSTAVASASAGGGKP
jgi:hypothetical protein